MAIRKTQQRAAWVAGIILALGMGLGTQSTLAAPAVYGPITQGDSLWSVAHKMGGVNIQQRMQALFKANPTAFVNGDINRLKVGAVLNLDAAAATATPSAPAAVSPPANLAQAAAPKAAVPSAVSTPAAAPTARSTVPALGAATPAPVALAPTAATASAAAVAPPVPPAGAPAGEVIKLVGRASAANDEGDIRALQQGNPVNSGETVVTAPASFVRMKLSDGGYIVLRPSTRFQIADYRYTESPADSRSVFNLLKGGFRAVTGAIGKRNHSAVTYKTAVATIGIRGTDFEVADCSLGCPDLSIKPKPGLYFKVFQGGVAVNEKPYDVDQAGYVPPEGGDPHPLAFDDPASPLNQDPSPPADPDKCF